MGAYKGWNKEFQKYLLQPVDKNGKKIIRDDYSKFPGYKNGNEWFYPVSVDQAFNPKK